MATLLDIDQLRTFVAIADTGSFTRAAEKLFYSQSAVSQHIAALEQYLATEQARASAQIALVAAVANTWLALAADRENLKLAQATLETQQETYEMIRRRAEVGASSDLDLRQAQTRVDAARVDIARYTSQVALDENALTLLVGSPVPAELLPEALSDVAAPRDFTPGLPSEVLQRRPDIVLASDQCEGPVL